MLITLIILVLAAIFFMNGKIRSDLVALCALILLLVFQILTPEEALSGFSNPIVIMMIGLFVVGGAIFQTGLAKMISNKMLKLAGKSELRLFILLMAVTSAIGAFVSNTGTVALLLPIAVSLAASFHMNPSRLLMPIAFASSMGGMMTLIGTPPNLVIQNTLTEAGFQPLEFFSFLPVGLICVGVGTLVLIPLSKYFLSKTGTKEKQRGYKNKSLNDLAAEYQLGDHLFRMHVAPHSPLIGKTAAEADIRNRYDLNILEIRRITVPQSRFFKTISQRTAPNTVLLPDDLLYVMGDFDKVQHFAETYRLELLDTHMPEERSAINRNSLDFYDIGIAEIVLMPTSGLINRTIGESGFRDKYHVNILGIRRKREYILNNLKDEKMHSGDVLLVQGSWNAIGHLSQENSDWVVLGQPLNEAAKVTLDYKAPLAGVIMLLMIMAMVFDGDYDRCGIDGTDGLFPQRGSCIQNHQLGEYRTDCGHAADVDGPGKDRRIRIHIQQFGQRPGRLRPDSPVGRHLFHHIFTDHVYQQYRHGRTSGSHSPAIGNTNRNQPISVPFCGNRRSQHVFCLAVLHAAQCTGHAGRTIHFHGLHQSRIAIANSDRHSDDTDTSPALPLLTGPGRSSLVRSEQPASLQRIAFITY